LLSALLGGTTVGAVIIMNLPLERADEAVALWRDSGLTRPWNDPQADLTRALTGPASTVLAAVDDDVLTGTAMVGHDGHRGWVYYLAVRADRHSTGVGRALMLASEQWLIQRHVPKVNVMVRTTNITVVDFYKSLGYQDGEVLVLGKFLRP
jgi:ribosomal protein S18 acetylase RimI-like enzyme